MPVKNHAHAGNLQRESRSLDAPACMPRSPASYHTSLSQSSSVIATPGRIRENLFESSASCWLVSLKDGIVKDGMRKRKDDDHHRKSQHQAKTRNFPSHLKISDNSWDRRMESASDSQTRNHAFVHAQKNFSSDDILRFRSKGKEARRSSDQSDHAGVQSSPSPLKTESTESLRGDQRPPPSIPRSLFTSQNGGKSLKDAVSSFSNLSDPETHAVPLYIAGFEADLVRFHERYDRDIAEIHGCLETIHQKLQELALNLQPKVSRRAENLALKQKNQMDRAKTSHSIHNAAEIDSIDSRNDAEIQQKILTGGSNAPLRKVGLNKKAGARRRGFRVKNKRTGGGGKEKRRSDGGFSHPSGFDTDIRQPVKCHENFCPEEDAADAIASSRCCCCNPKLSSADLLPNRHSLPVGFFRETVQILRALIRNFSTILIESKEQMMKKLGIELRTTVLALILCELQPDAQLADSEHLKYSVQAFVSRTLFRDFETETYGADDHSARHSSFSGKDFHTTLAAVSPSDAITAKNPLYNRSFHLFCRKKLQLFQERLDWFEKWPEKLMEAFLDAAKYAWIIHQQAYSFDPPDRVTLFFVNECAEFDPSYMEAVEDAIAGFSDQTTQIFSTKVQFMVIPGFEIQQKIIKSQVYLNPLTVWCPPKTRSSF